MARKTRSEGCATGGPTTGLPAIGIAAFAVVRCGAGPLLAAAASSLALATVVRSMSDDATTARDARTTD
jgi:hypothetical protein